MSDGVFIGQDRGNTEEQRWITSQLSRDKYQTTFGRQNKNVVPVSEIVAEDCLKNMR